MEGEKEIEILDNSSTESTRVGIPIVLATLLLLAVTIIFVLNKTKDKTPSLVLPSSINNVVSTTVVNESEEINTIEVKATSFAFNPKTIKVKEGEKVKIVLTNDDGTHDFVIDEMDVKSKTLNTGDMTEVIFTASKKGEFEYYCSVANHRSMGMVGKLIVE